MTERFRCTASRGAGSLATAHVEQIDDAVFIPVHRIVGMPDWPIPFQRYFANIGDIHPVVVIGIAALNRRQVAPGHRDLQLMLLDVIRLGLAQLRITFPGR